MKKGQVFTDSGWEKPKGMRCWRKDSIPIVHDTGYVS